MIDIKTICKDKGLRMTEQRNTIADVVSSMITDGHPDVNEIFLKSKNHRVLSIFRHVLESLMFS